MAKRAVGNPLALAVLALLTERPTHPYDIARTLRQRRKEQSIKLNYGSLYTVIEQLVRVGFLTPDHTARDTARPERTVYAITDAGRFELFDWMSELVSTPHKEYRTFEAALALLAVLPPDEAERLLVIRLERLSAQVRALRIECEDAVANGLHPIHLVETEYRIALDAAELAFVQRFVDQLRTDPSFAAPWWAFHRGPEEDRDGR
ncbi:MAG: PadR family transcriptional regulator [Myxococcota bacterium]